MNRPTLEVAEIIRAHGKRFLQRHRSRLTWPQVKVLRAIARCRTAALVISVPACHPITLELALSCLWRSHGHHGAVPGDADAASLRRSVGVH